jgi:hypothetical protein|eukprot:COSAG01_NODE_2777_length_7092_cov_1.978121_3_plen_188_part_00
MVTLHRHSTAEQQRQRRGSDDGAGARAGECSLVGGGAGDWTISPVQPEASATLMLSAASMSAAGVSGGGGSPSQLGSSSLQGRPRSASRRARGATRAAAAAIAAHRSGSAGSTEAAISRGNDDVDVDRLQSKVNSIAELTKQLAIVEGQLKSQSAEAERSSPGSAAATAAAARRWAEAAGVQLSTDE